MLVKNSVLWSIERTNTFFLTDAFERDQSYDDIYRLGGFR